MATYIGIQRKKGLIKTVEYLSDGEPEFLGVTLYEYFKDMLEARTIVKTTVDRIEEDEIFFEEDEINVFEEYESMEDFMESFDSDNIYYIFNDVWYVIGQGNHELTELEIILDEGLL